MFTKGLDSNDDADGCKNKIETLLFEGRIIVALVFIGVGMASNCLDRILRSRYD